MKQGTRRGVDEVERAGEKEAEEGKKYTAVEAGTTLCWLTGVGDLQT